MTRLSSITLFEHDRDPRDLPDLRRLGVAMTVCTAFGTRMQTGLTVLLLVALTGCAASTNPISGRRAFNYAWSPAQEIRIGQEADPQIVAQYGLYENVALAEYVDSLGQALADVSHFRRPGIDPIFGNMSFHFRVLDSPVVNAFALPGGFIYVTRGLLAHLENEAQLAVVLGHEIGHVVGRHGSKAMWRRKFGSGALLLGAIGGQAVFGGNAAQNIMNFGGTASQLLFLKYGRGAESESDQLGVDYAALAGYDASQASAFFRSLKRLGEQSGQSLPGLLSSHPDPGDRELYIQQRSARWASELRMDRVGRGALFRHVGGLVYGTDPRQGFEENGVFYHPQMAFSFPVPAAYTLVNQPGKVVMAAQDQQAVIVMEIDTEHQRARSAADAFKARDDIRVVESGIGQAGGMAMHYVIADATSSDGQELRLRKQYIEKAGTVFVFTGYVLRTSFDDHAASFSRTMQGFRRVTDPKILDTKPRRVTLRRNGQSTTFGALIGSTFPPGVSQLSLAILNQVEISDQIPAGKTYKTVQ